MSFIHRVSLFRPLHHADFDFERGTKVIMGQHQENEGAARNVAYMHLGTIRCSYQHEFYSHHENNNQLLALSIFFHETFRRLSQFAVVLATILQSDMRSVFGLF